MSKLPQSLSWVKKFSLPSQNENKATSPSLQITVSGAAYGRWRYWEGTYVGDPVGSREGVVGKENISVGNSFYLCGGLSKWKQKKREKRGGQENVETYERKSRCCNAWEQGNEGGQWSLVQHKELHWQPIWVFFSVSPEDTSTNHADRGDFLHEGDAKVFGSPEKISLSLTCLISPAF